MLRAGSRSCFRALQTSPGTQEDEKEEWKGRCIFLNMSIQHNFYKEEGRVTVNKEPLLTHAWENWFEKTKNMHTRPVTSI